jgi:glycosyltransferase involved in cell wall biosynthesis
MSRQDGGTSMYMQQLADTLGELMELHIVAHRAQDELPVRHAILHYLSRSWNVWRVRADYLKLLGDIQPDIVHVNCCWQPYFAYAAIWAKEAGYPVILSPHGMLEPWIVRRHYLTRKVPSLLAYQRRAFFASDMIHATAESERQHIEQISHYCSFLSNWHPTVQVISNGVETDGIEVRTSWQKSRRILFLSRMHPKKGIDLLLRAFAEVWKDNGPLNEYVLQIAGDGDTTYLNSLKTLSERLGLSSQVQWLGGVYNEEKWSLLRQADLFVLPTHSENFGIVVAEALASGTPVLTTYGAPWSVLNTERCGWCVDVTVDALRDALTSFARLDESDLRLMGLRGRRLVEENYDARKLVGEFVKMYESVCC